MATDLTRTCPLCGIRPPFDGSNYCTKCTIEARLARLRVDLLKRIHRLNVAAQDFTNGSNVRFAAEVNAVRLIKDEIIELEHSDALTDTEIIF